MITTARLLKSMAADLGPVAVESLGTSAQPPIQNGSVAVTPAGALHFSNAGPDYIHASWEGEGTPWRLPRASASRMVQELHGRVRGKPTTGHPAVDELLKGKGDLLGRGNRSMGFRVGDHVVKASTVAPMDPETGTRTPGEAADLTRGEAKAHRELAGHAMVPDADEVHADEGQGYLVKPYLKPTSKLRHGEHTLAEDFVAHAHGKGWTLNEPMKLGRDGAGALKVMDLAGATRSTSPARREDDHRHLDQIFRANGLSRGPTGRDLDTEHSARRLALTTALLSADSTDQAAGPVGDLDHAWARYARTAHATMAGALDAPESKAWDAASAEHEHFRKQVEGHAQRARTTGLQALAKCCDMGAEPAELRKLVVVLEVPDMARPQVEMLTLVAERIAGVVLEREANPHLTTLFVGANMTADVAMAVALEVRAMLAARKEGPVEVYWSGFNLFGDRVVAEVNAYRAGYLHDAFLKRLAPWVTAFQHDEYRPHVTIGKRQDARSPAMDEDVADREEAQATQDDWARLLAIRIPTGDARLPGFRTGRVQIWWGQDVIGSVILDGVGQETMASGVVAVAATG